MGRFLRWFLTPTAIVALVALIVALVRPPLEIGRAIAFILVAAVVLVLLLDRLWTWLRNRRRPSRQFPFVLLHSATKLRAWLRQTQRITLIDNAFLPRATLVRPGPQRSVSRLLLLRAPVDIGKTREALWIIEHWIAGRQDIRILVPKNLLSLPDLRALPPHDLEALQDRNVVVLLDDIPTSCTDPGVASEANRIINRLIGQLEMRASSLLVVGTGRSQALVAALGQGYEQTVPFDRFEIQDIPDFTPGELDVLIHDLASRKNLNVATVAPALAKAAGRNSAENIVTFLESLKSHAALSHKLGWWRRTFGDPIALPKTQQITDNMVRLVSGSSSQTWNNLVYSPATKTYPELAAVYQAVAVLAAVGIMPYVELVVSLAPKLLSFGLLKGYRVERAFRVLLKHELYLQLDDSGVVHCPDVVTNAISFRPETHVLRAIGRCLPRFTETRPVAPLPPGGAYLGRIIAGVASVFAINVSWILLLAWLYPGDLDVSVALGATGTMVALVTVMFLGYRFRSDEWQLLTFFWMSFSAGSLAHGAVIGNPEVVSGGRIVVLLAETLMYSILLTLVATELYRVHAVRSTFRPLPITTSDVKQLIRHLSFASYGRTSTWVTPIRVSRETGWIRAAIVWVSFVMFLTISLRVNLREHWLGVAYVVFSGVGATVALLTRPYRFLWESCIIAFFFALAMILISLRPALHIMSGVLLMELWARTWLLFLLAGFGSWIWLGRRKMTDRASSLSGESLYPSETGDRPHVLSATAATLVGAVCAVVFVLFLGLGLRSAVGHLAPRLSSLGTLALGGSITEHRFADSVWKNLDRWCPNSGRVEYHRGREALLELDPEGAVEHLRRASTSMAGHKDAAKWLSFAAVCAGQDSLASRAIGQALSLGTEQPDIAVAYAAVLFSQERYVQSLAVARAVALRGPECARAWDAWVGSAWDWIASSLIELDQCDSIREVVRAAGYITPEVLLAEARCIRAQGDVEGALRLYKEVAFGTGGGRAQLIAREHLRCLSGNVRGDWPKLGAIVYGALPKGRVSSEWILRPGDVLTGVDERRIRCAFDVTRLRVVLEDSVSLTWHVARRGNRLSIETGPGPLGVGLLDF